MPPLPLPDPGTALILFIIGGVASVVAFTAHNIARQEGPRLSERLPKPPKLPGEKDRA